MPQDPVYLDTSAFYALLDRSDVYHHQAKSLWPILLEGNVHLFTSNYVVSETISLLQYRLGFDAASIWYKDILGILDIIYVDPNIHRQAYELWLSLGRRKYSLVDCISYIVMLQNKIEKVFCFKRFYSDQGFKLVASFDPASSFYPGKEEYRNPASQRNRFEIRGNEEG